MPSPPVPRPLLATADPDVLDAALRVCAAVGVEPLVAHDPAAARRAWSGALLVLVGADLAPALVDPPPRRRPDVALVATDLDDARVWALGVALGAERVVLPGDADAEAWLVEHLSRGLADAALGSRPPAPVVGVVAGCGGAGASTLAVALAVTAARQGGAPFLLDADPWGCGLDLLVGADLCPGPRWPDLAHARGRLDPAALQGALPGAGGVSVLACRDAGDVPPEALASVVDAARLSSDLVVVDVARRPGALAEVLLPRCDAALLVVPSDLRRVGAAERVLGAVGALPPWTGAVVRRTAQSDLRAEEVATWLGLPLAGAMDEDAELAPALRTGRAPGSWDRGPLPAFCRGFLGDWARRAAG
ncbi:septum site-determining protein Ssd [Vallicoccus soli]|uniref:septum site-determining protein Ssd n=1 Tax=Vallicoccus soli TaxID=2339232 RepID=UPI00140323AE|nr:septum site-determining protein Ssd [Vallicoccus soli]